MIAGPVRLHDLMLPPLVQLVLAVDRAILFRRALLSAGPGHAPAQPSGANMDLLVGPGARARVGRLSTWHVF